MRKKHENKKLFSTLEKLNVTLTEVADLLKIKRSKLYFMKIGRQIIPKTLEIKIYNILIAELGEKIEYLKKIKQQEIDIISQV